MPFSARSGEARRKKGKNSLIMLLRLSLKAGRSQFRKTDSSKTRTPLPKSAKPKASTPLPFCLCAFLPVPPPLVWASPAEFRLFVAFVLLTFCNRSVVLTSDDPTFRRPDLLRRPPTTRPSDDLTFCDDLRRPDLPTT